TRQMVNQAITGKLRDAEYVKDDMFGLDIPVEVEDVPQTLLNPINAWSKPEAYRTQAQDLINRFKSNFEKFGEDVDELAVNGGFE
ncbi:phosphoenolpyruvate carboxykinase (ATP), partial [Staphylococcus saprophyticus]|nr:phosphoenolpyruvate carboxykinase (ATP) [Staphylococcus saprophyticus]